MAITSVATASIPENNSVKQDLTQSIKDNLDKSINYKIIDKLLAAKKADESAETTRISRKDSLSLSSSAIKITAENQNNGDSQNQSENLVFLQSSKNTLSFSSEVMEEPIKKSDPLAFDLDGNGITTTGVKHGIEFDIDGDGKTEQSSFISGNDAFLAYDKNGNGLIDSGKELFGDQNGARNGFEELRKYDDNKDGIIDKNDAIYSDLKLVSIDQQQQLKITSLADHNIQSINLSYNNKHQAINFYDSIEQSGQFTRNNGTRGYTADIMLGHK